MYVIFKTNAGRLGARYTKRATKITPAMVAAQTAILQKMKKKAEYYSSGTAYKIGRDKGYPYSPRENRPPLPAYFLNFQTGNLKKGWRTRTTVNPRSITGTIYNLMDYSRFMTALGTSRMIGRPILEQVMKVIRKDATATYHSSLFKVLSSEKGP